MYNTHTITHTEYFMNNWTKKNLDNLIASMYARTMVSNECNMISLRDTGIASGNVGGNELELIMMAREETLYKIDIVGHFEAGEFEIWAHNMTRISAIDLIGNPVGTLLAKYAKDSGTLELLEVSNGRD